MGEETPLSIDYISVFQSDRWSYGRIHTWAKLLMNDSLINKMKQELSEDLSTFVNVIFYHL